MHFIVGAAKKRVAYFFFFLFWLKWLKPIEIVHYVTAVYSEEAMSPVTIWKRCKNSIKKKRKSTYEALLYVFIIAEKNWLMQWQKKWKQSWTKTINLCAAFSEILQILNNSEILSTCFGFLIFSYFFLFFFGLSSNSEYV